jgi:prefoldin subunit 5
MFQTVVEDSLSDCIEDLHSKKVKLSLIKSKHQQEVRDLEESIASKESEAETLRTLYYDSRSIKLRVA